jgi:hypothetical protein
MAQPAPKTKDWKAHIDSRPPHPPGHLVVIGEVEVDNIMKYPQLKVHTPQGINPKILLLDLTIVFPGEGFPKMVFKQARLDRHAGAGQYAEVEILWEGHPIAKFPVGEIA